MSSTSTRDRLVQRHGGQNELRFVNFPLRDEGFSAWFTAALFVAVSIFAGVASSSPLMGGLVLGALAISARRLWIPTYCEVTAGGLVETALWRKQRISWSQVARYEPRRRGVLLSAVGEKTPLAAFHSRYICSGKYRDELVDAVEYHLGVAGRPAGSIDSTASLAGRSEDQPDQSNSF